MVLKETSQTDLKKETHQNSNIVDINVIQSIYGEKQRQCSHQKLSFLKESFSSFLIASTGDLLAAVAASSTMCFGRASLTANERTNGRKEADEGQQVAVLIAFGDCL